MDSDETSPRELKDEVDGVGIIIADSFQLEQVTRVLLMERGPQARFTGLLENPGGSVEEGELPEQAALRELREELDVSPAAMRLLHSYQPLVGQPKQDHIFLAVIDGEPRIMEATKCSALTWVPIGELSKAQLTQYAQEDFRRLGWLSS